MPVHDLTPQLRTRLSKVERAVGWFVILATFLLVGGFGYYIYHTAKNKGWFLIKVPYFTYLKDATGLKVGDTVKMVGFDVGEITLVEGTEAGRNWFTENNMNVFVQFIIYEPYYGYIWTDSKVRIGTGDFLGKRLIEVTKGATGQVSVVQEKGLPLRVMSKNFPKEFNYQTLAEAPKGFWIKSDESPALTVRLDQIASQVEHALPGILDLTNQIRAVMSNTTTLLATVNQTVQQAQPSVSNLAVITSLITNANGSLGQWLIPTNLNSQLISTLHSVTGSLQHADSLMHTSETNLAVVAGSLNSTLINLANITSNLNTQVQTNDQLVSNISRAIVQADTLMQGLKKHWLLRSAFKEAQTNAPTTWRNLPPPKAGKWR